MTEKEAEYQEKVIVQRSNSLYFYVVMPTTCGSYNIMCDCTQGILCHVVNIRNGSKFDK